MDATTTPTTNAAPAQPSAPLPPIWKHTPPKGEIYTDVLARLHEHIKPATYMEVGVNTGTALQLARCSSIAVDPAFSIGKLNLNGKPRCLFYQMSSDEFFKTQNPTQLLGAPIDMAFLDGLHWYEFLLRDFINTEPHCKPNSIILLHDCLPRDEHVGRRNFGDQSLGKRSDQWASWAGDVWKTLSILCRYRPDLKINVFDAIPTGLVAITGLNPASTVLRERYFELVEEYRDYSLAQHGEDYIAGLKVLSTRDYKDHSTLGTLFWL